MFFLLFNEPATTEIYTLSLHDALPISEAVGTSRRSQNWGADHIKTEPPLRRCRSQSKGGCPDRFIAGPITATVRRSEEHTSELQSQFHLVCRLLLENKKQR